MISPLLANLFLHYAFDKWMQGHFPTLPFERYADDVICHCVSEKQARYLMEAIERRMAECRLELNMLKTKIVSCRNENRSGYAHVGFDFLGYTFRPRLSKSYKGKFFVNFSPAVSNEANKGYPAGNPELEPAPAYRQVPRGLGADVQPCYPGLDQLLWRILQVGDLPDVVVPGPETIPMGKSGNVNA